jgi:hypothetical protein
MDFWPEPANFRFLQKNQSVLMGIGNLTHSGSLIINLSEKYKVVTSRKLLYIW